jgi:hypothetical protein
MSQYSLKPITETSWILQNDGNRVALVTQNDAGIVAIGKLAKSRFKDIKDLEKFVGSKIEIEKHEDEEVAELGNIKGFPVKHVGAIAVEEQELPVYKRTATSNTHYSAGYYGVKFPNGWVTSYCPKLTTLTENEYIGPFQSKLEMQNSITQKKRQIDL